MKSVTHLFPKDTCIFHMPRATVLKMGTALEVWKIMDSWLITNKHYSSLDQTSLENIKEE